ncbi:MAG: adenylate/guanylate cyclase domain-containing protein [Acidimicrobiales bacterium]
MDIPATEYARTLEGEYLAYQILGDGPLDLLLPMVGGFAVDLMWEEPAIVSGLNRLASFARVITFDPRGFGSSAGVDAKSVPAVQTWMDDLGAVMDAANSERAAVLSWGECTPAVMLFAATYPQRVSGLVLVNAYARFLRNSECDWGMPPNRLPAYVEMIQKAWGTGAVTETLAPSMVRSDEQRRLWARSERLSATPDRVAIPLAFMESDVTDVLSAIQAPTLLISRRDDRHVRPEHSRYLASQIPGAKLVELSGDDNFLFAGRAEEILDETQEFVTGVRPGPLLDRVLATVLFTDIVGSTARAAELGDERWSELLTMHNEAVRRELERFRGVEVDTAGDGFLARFDGPARAIQCGLAIRDKLQSFGIDIRAGLHTGEIVTVGDDLRGIAVHIGARVGALADRSEVLVSRTVVDLVAGSGIRFVDRGEHQLKGVPGSWQLYAVDA